MFTGLIEGLGTIVAVESSGAAKEFTLDTADSLKDCENTRVGDSVALNGCCLTITRIEGSRWRFQAGSETLSRTNLGELSSGSTVNVERCLHPVDRLGGHFVQGHIDGTGRVSRIDREGEWIKMWFTVPPQLADQMVSKGSVAVDGVSLTLVDVGAGDFSVALIPHTLQVTTLGRLQPGDRVNIETDILGKYIQKMWLASQMQQRDPVSVEYAKE